MKLMHDPNVDREDKDAHLQLLPNSWQIILRLLICDYCIILKCVRTKNLYMNSFSGGFFNLH